MTNIGLLATIMTQTATPARRAIPASLRLAFLFDLARLKQIFVAFISGFFHNCVLGIRSSPVALFHTSDWQYSDIILKKTAGI